jgi:hypothetical protein
MEQCEQCSHPWVEHLGGYEGESSAECGECIYEIEHGYRRDEPCTLRIPDEVMRRADAAAAEGREAMAGRHFATFDERSIALAEILQAWDVLGVYQSEIRPDDDMEYDGLVAPIRSWLEEGAGPEELSSRLVRLLRREFGLDYPDEAGEVEFMRKVHAWWSTTS